MVTRDSHSCVRSRLMKMLRAMPWSCISSCLTPGKDETREFLKSLTLFKFSPDSIAHAHLQFRQNKTTERINSAWTYQGHRMKPARLIKRIKHAERKKGREIPVELAINPKRWSSAVRSWIVEFQERERDESLPAFDSLFEDASSPSSPGAKSGAS